MKPVLVDQGKNLTKKNIESFEKKISQKLPNDYKEFLLENNGGSIEDNYYNYFYYKEDENIFIGVFFPLDEIFNALDDYDFIDGFDKNWAIIATGGEDYRLFMSLDEIDFGHIYFANITDENVEKDYIFITNSFSNLINNIEKERDVSDAEYLLCSRKFNELKEEIKNGKIDINEKIYGNTRTLFNVLISNAASKNLVEKFNETCDMIRFFYENGTNIDEIDFVCHIDIIEYILSLGYDINQRDKKGKTPLIKDVFGANCYLERFKFILDKGGDKSIKDNDGKTVHDYSEQYFKEKRVSVKDYKKIQKLLE
ncbi:MAG: SMI1/KNR4 family protein [Cyanobacteriota bacterium]